MDTRERKIGHEELVRRIREASMRNRREAERAAADFGAANADGLWVGRDTPAPAL